MCFIFSLLVPCLILLAPAGISLCVGNIHMPNNRGISPTSTSFIEEQTIFSRTPILFESAACRETDSKNKLIVLAEHRSSCPWSSLNRDFNYWCQSRLLDSGKTSRSDHADPQLLACSVSIQSESSLVPGEAFPSVRADHSLLNANPVGQTQLVPRHVLFTTNTSTCSKTCMSKIFDLAIDRACRQTRWLFLRTAMRFNAT